MKALHVAISDKLTELDELLTRARKCRDEQQLAPAAAAAAPN